jgi:topoisomerase IA-like protein
VRKASRAENEAEATKNIIDSLLIRAKVAEGEKFDSIVIADKETFESAMKLVKVPSASKAANKTAPKKVAAKKTATKKTAAKKTAVKKTAAKKSAK